MHKVSICIPTYNNLIAFQRCFESVVVQTYKDYEVIITDDSTNDDIKNFCETLQLTDNIHYHKNPQSLGSPENWNESIRRASGEYIKILHHDDFFTYENSLQILVDLLDQNSDTDFAFVSSRRFYNESKTFGETHKPSEQQIDGIKKNPASLLNGNYIGAPSAVIYRNKTNLLFDKNTIWFVDVDLYYQILSENNNIAVSNLDAISIGIGDSQITVKAENDKAINIKEFFYLLDKWQINKLKNTVFEESALTILQKFNIKNKREIRESGYAGDLPLDINTTFIKIYRKRILNFIKK